MVTTINFINYITDHHNTESNKVSAEEHIAFLAIWLSRYIFCYKSLEVAKRFLTLENQLHARHNICLSQLILGWLYESLGYATEFLKNYQLGTNLLLDGPYWLLQLWLNATFEPLLKTHNTLNKDDESIINRRIEGTRLALLNPIDEGLSLKEAFIGYVMMFAKSQKLTPSMAHFANRTHGHEWFTIEFPAPSTYQE